MEDGAVSPDFSPRLRTFRVPAHLIRTSRVAAGSGARQGGAHMRQTRLLSLAVVGIFLLASSAISMAGDWDWSSPSETYGPAGSHPSMESGSQATSPDQGNYESQETLEAGKLPSGENTMSSGSDESFPIVEQGGAEFRDGIDTGP